jgi:peptide/nickel transport system permease protein
VPAVEAAPVAVGASAVDDEPVLRVEDLRVLLPGDHTMTPLVDGVSFDVRPGETIGIVGESGSGKSLTALAIAQLVQHPLHVEARTLEFLGNDLRREPNRPMRSMLGTCLAIVFQDPSSAFNPTMRVGKQIAEVAETHLHTDRKGAAAMAVERLRSVRVAAPAHRARQYPHELSGGMRQRAMLAMALMGSPRLLVCDEPTTGLDVTIQAQILDLLASVQRESGTAVLLVSHDIAVVSGFCDRVIVMYGGTVVEDLPVDKLLTGCTHPYTAALLSTVPEVMADRDRPLATIAGRPPEPHNRPLGCAFSPRCAYATQQCSDERPPMRDADAHHRVACWHPIAQQRVEISSGAGKAWS